jgi:hypothetical protein
MMDAETPDGLVYARIDNPEPVLAGTLTLMSAFLTGGCMHVAQKVIHNLTVLSTRPEFSDEFRRLCLNLRAHWCNECARGTARPPAEAAEVAAEGAETPAVLPHDRQTLH